MVLSDGRHHTQIMKGVLDMCLLATIVEDPAYGYGMVQKLNGRGWVIAQEGSIYPVLKRLEKAGFITSELVASSSGPARKYYSATAAGVELLELWAADWRSVRDGVDAVLSGVGKQGQNKKEGPKR
jgi:PadR family transcriptional regulator PadR